MRVGAFVRVRAHAQGGWGCRMQRAARPSASCMPCNGLQKRVHAVNGHTVEPNTQRNIRSHSMAFHLDPAPRVRDLQDCFDVEAYRTGHRDLAGFDDAVRLRRPRPRPTLCSVAKQALLEMRIPVQGCQTGAKCPIQHANGTRCILLVPVTNARRSVPPSAGSARVVALLTWLIMAVRQGMGSHFWRHHPTFCLSEPVIWQNCFCHGTEQSFYEAQGRREALLK
jgi:hypothetical protein